MIRLMQLFLLMSFIVLASSPWSMVAADDEDSQIQIDEVMLDFLDEEIIIKGTNFDNGDLVVAFTAPEIASEWALDPQSLGVLFSSGLFGMAAGSLFIAPLADRMGRRNIILICLVIISVGMLASAFTNSIFELAAMRVITGLGIGGALASITTITAEYSSKKRQGFAISLVQVGYPIGATIGGTIAAVLIVQYGWRSVFIFGAICSALMIPMVLRFLPESLEYLITHQPKNALGKINSLLSKLGQPSAARASSRGSSTRAVYTGCSACRRQNHRGASTLRP